METTLAVRLSASRPERATSPSALSVSRWTVDFICFLFCFSHCFWTHFFKFRIETSQCNKWKKETLYLSLLLVSCRQGLFRIAAGASKLKKLKAALDCSTSQLEEFYSDPHAVAGTSSAAHARRAKAIWSPLFSHRFSFFTRRSPEVLPQGTSWTSNDFWPVWWVDTGLQVRRHTLAHMTPLTSCKIHPVCAQKP